MVFKLNLLFFFFFFFLILNVWYFKLDKFFFFFYIEKIERDIYKLVNNYNNLKNQN